MAKEYNLSIDTGEGLKFIFHYRQKTTHDSLVPEDSTARMVMRDVAGVGAPVELTTESGHIVLDPETGRCETTIPRTEAVDLPFKQANYKWYLHRPDGIRKKLFFGAVKKG